MYKNETTKTMKKILFILFATLLFCGEAWAGTPVSVLQEGHYYRIRNTSTGHYLCWVGQEGESAGFGSVIFDPGTDAFRQPMILISADKALTSPGSIFRYQKVSSRDGLYTQGIEVGGQLDNYSVAAQKELSGRRSANWNNSSTLTFSRPDDASMKFRITSGVKVTSFVQRPAYWEEAYTSGQANYPDGYLGITTGATAQWLFEEVDGQDAQNANITANGNETKSMHSFLGFPPADKSYNVMYNWIGNGTEYDVTENGPRTFQITDVQQGEDADGITWYYATMCLPFPVEVPSNVQCFFVNPDKQAVPIEYSDDNLDGTGRFAKKVNVIPAGMSFVARSQSNDPNDNKFVPYIVNANPTAPTNKGDNDLDNANATSYLVKAARSSSYTADGNGVSGKYRLSKTANGKVEFTGTALSNSDLTDGNRAYFGGESEPIVYEPAEVELADLIYEENGAKWTDKDYVKIKDNLLVCYVNEKAGLVFARDMQNNKNYWSKVTETPSNYYNFTPEEGNVVGAAQKLLTPDDYDQSNWVIIKVPTTIAGDFQPGMTIPGGNLKGYIAATKPAHKAAPVFNMLGVENQSGNTNFTFNTYSVAHLMADANTHLLKSGLNGNDYFFMTPKPAEVANVTWAILKRVGDNVYAYIPAKDGNNNALDFHGRVLLRPEMYGGNAGAMCGLVREKAS